MPKLSDKPAKQTNGKAPKKGKETAKKPEKKATAKKSDVVKALEQGPDREIIYPDHEARIYSKSSKAGPITVALAKKFLGWDEETEQIKFGDVYTLIDKMDHKVRLHNNPRNRPFDRQWCDTLTGAILRREWQLNGEPLIIGQTGTTLAAQHRLVAVVLAAQEWEKNREAWPQWDGEPYLESFMVLGIVETDEVVNTIDTGKPRSLPDVIYRSEYFADLGSDEREECSKVAAVALKFLGLRTGAWLNAFSPKGKRTHAEQLDLLGRHNRLLGFVRYAWKEDSGKKANEPKLNDYCHAGYAAGLMFLQACSGSTPGQIEEYRKAHQPTEDMLDWEQKDNAEEFWTLLAGRAEAFKAVENARRKMIENYQDKEPRVPDRLALLVKAWNAYSQGKPLTHKLIWPDYVADEDDPALFQLNECPTVGGIDRGEPEDDDDLTPDNTEEVEERIEEERTKKKNGEAPIKKSRKKNGDKKEEPALGSHVYVSEDGGHWEGELIDAYDGSHHRVGKVRNEEGKEFEAPMSDISTEVPQ